MTTLETVRAWKDEEYRDTLPAAEREKLPAHPAGVIDFEPAQPEGWRAFGPLNIPHTRNKPCTISGCTVKQC